MMELILALTTVYIFLYLVLSSLCTDMVEYWNASCLSNMMSLTVSIAVMNGNLYILI